METPQMEQGPAPSIESRIEALMMGGPKPKPEAPKAAEAAEVEAPEGEAPAAEEAEAPGADEATPTADELFEIEVDGVKYALPKPLEKAVLQERDYTQKAQ